MYKSKICTIITKRKYKGKIGREIKKNVAERLGNTRKNFFLHKSCFYKFFVNKGLYITRNLKSNSKIKWK